MGAKYTLSDGNGSNPFILLASLMYVLARDYSLDKQQFWIYIAFEETSDR